MNRCFALGVLLLTAMAAHAQTVTFSTVATNGYYAVDTNSCAIALNNIITSNGYQFIAYYDISRNVNIARRATGGSTWTNYNLTAGGVTAPLASEISDDHNVIAMAVDSAGKMHLSYNMHNQSLNYWTSNASVVSASLPSMGFTKQTAANAPTLFPSSGSTASAVTYPVFVTIPNSSNLLFTYRNGGTGGGSGNGNQYFNTYNPTTNTWTNTLVVDGISTSVNAYLNSPVYDSAGTLHVSWTKRSTSNWQTNSNIYYAQSPDNGATWYRQGGASQYGTPIQMTSGNANSAQIVKAFPEGSSYINQTSMAVDSQKRPIVATWYAPNYNVSTGTGDKNRQYMIEYHDGTQWRSTQLTNRTADTAIDSSAFAVRDLGRPIVLVDKQDRVLVVTRFHNNAMGSFANGANPGNGIQVMYSTNLMSGTPTWTTLTLSTTNMGSYEPTYDKALWDKDNMLNLFFEPTGLTGQTSGTIRVLQWDAAAFFAPVPEPALAAGLLLFCVASRKRKRPE